MTLRDENIELDWLALQYVAGDLDSAATERFELRLADDQAAREAVARAVELTQVIVAAESQIVQLEYVTTGDSTRSGAWSTRLSWMAIGGLLSLLIAVLVTSGVFQRQPASSKTSDELAAAWSQTRQEHPISLAIGDGEDETDILGDAQLLVDTPSWMTAAVVGVAGQGSVGSPSSSPEDEESSVN